MRVLFICMGNICRSPSAAGVFRQVLAARAPHLNVQVDSAGTHDYHVGESPDRRAIEAARRRGIDLSGLSARQVAPIDFEHFDYVLAMDRQNFATLLDRAPIQYRERIRLFMDFAPDAYTREVPDPYYGNANGFEEVLDLLEQASEGLVRELLDRAR
jgi:protein-tyrosine phosphatase